MDTGNGNSELIKFLKQIAIEAIQELPEIERLRFLTELYTRDPFDLTGSKPYSAALTFGELAIGDSFISFQLPGDNRGHGGLRKGAWLFKKVSKDSIDNAIRMSSCTSHASFTPASLVIKVM